jgi:hypothetical protein
MGISPHDEACVDEGVRVGGHLAESPPEAISIADKVQPEQFITAINRRLRASTDRYGWKLASSA